MRLWVCITTRTNYFDFIGGMYAQSQSIRTYSMENWENGSLIKMSPKLDN